MARLHVETPGDLEVVVTRQFAAPRELVFEAHSRPELLRRWMLGPDGWTMPVCDVDFRVGGAYTYTWRNDDGREMTLRGEFVDIAAPDRIVTTVEGDAPPHVSTVEFFAHEGGARLVNTIRFATREARDRMVEVGMTRGMERGYERLDDLFAEQGA